MTRNRPTAEQMRELFERMRAAQAKAEAERVLTIADEVAARHLARLLDDAAARVEAIDPAHAPAFLGECTHKFNDAWYDDLWYAVQTGETWWEQSHFFEGRSGADGKPEPLVEERGKFTLPRTSDAIRAAGVKVESERIAVLRSVLRGLQTAGWRALIGQAFTAERALAALVIEHGQRWFVMETPNTYDADIFAWDDGGMFRVGGMGRIDQAVGERTLLTFETVEGDAVPRLTQTARRYFRPSVTNSGAATQLARLLWQAAQAVRAVTEAPVAMRSRYSLQPRYPPSLPETYSSVLRPNEGKLRVPTDGKWPLYQPPGALRERSEYSDEAKAFHLALGKLEDAGWRELFDAAFGEKLTAAQTLALFVDTDAAVLVRDNATFRVTPNGLVSLAPVPYLDLHKLDRTFASLAAEN